MAKQLINDKEITALSVMGYGRPDSKPGDGELLKKNAYEWVTREIDANGTRAWVEKVDIATTAERTTRTTHPELRGSIADPSIAILPNGDPPIPEVQVRVFVDETNHRVSMVIEGSVTPNIPGSTPMSNWKSDLGNSGASEYLKLEPLADEVLRQIRQEYPGYEVIAVGHSLAGGEAQAFAVRNGISCAVLDSLPIAKDTINNLFGGPEAFAKAVEDWRAAGNTCQQVQVEGEVATAYYKEVRGEYYLGDNATVLPSGLTDSGKAIAAALDMFSGVGMFSPTTVLPTFTAALASGGPEAVQAALLHSSLEAWSRIRDLSLDEGGRAVIEPLPTDTESDALRKLESYTNALHPLPSDVPPDFKETVQQIDNAFGSWTAGYEPDTEDDTTWGGGLNDAPSRSEVYGEASTPAATTSLSDKLSKEIQDAANQLESDGTGRDFLGDADFSTDDIEVSANPSTPIILGDPIDRQPTIFSPDPNGLKPDITGTIDYTVSPIGTGGVVTGTSIFDTAAGGSGVGVGVGGGGGGGATATPTRDPDADLNETNLEIGSGDTLSGIAQANGVSLDELLTANPQLTHPDLIHPGQVINVPAKTGDEGSSGGDGAAGGSGGIEESSEDSIFTGEPIRVAADGSTMRDISAGLLGETGQTGLGENPPGGISAPPPDPVKGAFDSALSLVQAIQGGDELSALASGAKIINDIAKINEVAASDLPFSNNTLDGLSSVASLASALKRGDEVGAAIAGARIANTLSVASGSGPLFDSVLPGGVGTVASALGIYQSFKQGDVAGVAVNAIQLTAQIVTASETAAAALGSLGTAAQNIAPFVGALYALAQGNYLGAAIQIAAYFVPVIGWIYAAYTIISGLLSKKDKGPPTGEGHITVNPDGSLTAIATGKRGGDDIVRNALNDLITKAGNEGIALNPALLPSLKYNGSYYVLTYHNEGYQRAIASGDLVNLLLERARPLWTTLGVEGGTLYRQGNGSVVFMAEASAVKDLGMITGGGNVKGSPEVISVQKGDAVSSGTPNPGQIVPTARYLTEPANPLFGGRTGDLSALALGFGVTGLSPGGFVALNGLTGQGGGGGAGGGSGGVSYIHLADSLSSLFEPTPLSVALLGESAVLSFASTSFGNEASDITRPSAIATLLDSIPPTAPVFVPEAVRVLSVAQPLAPAPAEPVHDLTDMSAFSAFDPVAASMDVSGASDDTTGILSIETAAPNNPPLAEGEHFTGSEDAPLQWTAAQLAANDTDPEGEALTLTAVGGASHGVVSLTAGVITFTPEANYFGAAGFDYTVTDAQGASASATVSLDLAPANDAPLAGGEVLASDEDVIALIPASVLLANDTDVDQTNAREITSIGAGVRGRYRTPLELDRQIRIDVSQFSGAALRRAA